MRRIGRTRRAAKTGVAIALATGADAQAIGAIEKLSGTQIRPVEGLAAREPVKAEPERAPAAVEVEERKPARRRKRGRSRQPAPRVTTIGEPPKPAPEWQRVEEEAEPEEGAWNGPSRASWV